MNDGEQMQHKLTKNQKLMLYQVTLSGIFDALIIATMYTIYLDNWGGSALMYRDYLTSVGGLLLFIPIFLRVSKGHPYLMAQIYAAIDLLGLAAIIAYAMGYAPAYVIIVDTAIVTLGKLLVQPHRAYVNSIVCDGSRDFSATLGQTQVFSKILFAVIGLTITYFSVGIVEMSITAIVIRCAERHYTLQVVKGVYVTHPGKIDMCQELTTENTPQLSKG